jgi:uncharacterized membrane protein YdjX (TVP38/TMEM64 family)
MESVKDKEDNNQIDGVVVESKGWNWKLTVQILAFLGLGVIVALYFFPIPTFNELLEFIREQGVIWFYLAFVFLALVGVPSTPFFLVGGAAFSVSQNLTVIAIALILHFTLAWFIAAKWMRGPIKQFMLCRGVKLPQVRPDNQWRIAILIKFTPGVPLFIKNYLIGVAGVGFIPFLAVSGLSTYVLAAAFVTMGHSVIKGQLGVLLGGIGILIFSMALFRVLRDYLRAKKSQS